MDTWIFCKSYWLMLTQVRLQLLVRQSRAVGEMSEWLGILDGVPTCSKADFAFWGHHWKTLYHIHVSSRDHIVLF